ncbi:4-alpha-glucanotransferase [Pollutimonas bauzanensis]|uniref:4-alpha-glucanotransferase n=1 Tax=Pollutimonas bauzanensis TaxID=658167 RepID=UPI00333F5605
MHSFMSVDPALLRLSETVGLEPAWQDVHGQMHQVKEPILRSMLDTLGLPCGNAQQIADSQCELEQSGLSSPGAMLIVDVDEPPVFAYAGPLAYVLNLEDGSQYAGMANSVGPGMASIRGVQQTGYHQLLIGPLQITLAVAPKRCPSIDDIAGQRDTCHWGISAQVYSLSRVSESASGNLPVWPGWTSGGDFGALARLARHAGQASASALAISPVHAMFSADPQRYSPYSPSSRLFLNVAYIDPAIVMGELEVSQATRELVADWNGDKARRASVVDWNCILPKRLALLRQLFDRFRRQAADALVERYTAFRRQGGEALESHARYEALHAHYRAVLGPASGWQDWPAQLHDPLGQCVQAYAMQHEADIDFHVFLQWLADEGLRHVQDSARAAGMSIGLITDLAIGTDPRGSHAWSRQGEMLTGVSVGAPPDLYQSRGQYWSLTALSPRALRQNGYIAFLETLRAALRHAGGVRIDHILGLARMWLIPQGASPVDGVYMRYPRADMMRLLALEAWRHKAIVVGENLGTVPEGFNDTLRQQGILGTSVLWFERSSAGFLPPHEWSAHAIATTTTHDLPTLAGWWEARDLDWRERLGQIPDGAAAQQRDIRKHEKTALWKALRDAGCISSPDTGLPVAAPREAILEFVSSTPAPLVIIPLEDLLGLIEQPNLPGSEGADPVAHPNWVQCLPAGVDGIFSRPDVRRSIDAIKHGRRHS